MEVCIHTPFATDGSALHSTPRHDGGAGDQEPSPRQSMVRVPSTSNPASHVSVAVAGWVGPLVLKLPLLRCGNGSHVAPPQCIDWVMGTHGVAVGSIVRSPALQKDSNTTRGENGPSPAVETAATLAR